MLSHIQSSPLSIWKMSFSNIEHNLGNINGIRCSLIPDTIIQSGNLLLNTYGRPLAHIKDLCPVCCLALRIRASIFWYILFVFFCNCNDMIISFCFIFMTKINDFFYYNTQLFYFIWVKLCVISILAHQIILFGTKLASHSLYSWQYQYTNIYFNALHSFTFYFFCKLCISL